MEGVCFINNGNRLMWINRTNITIMPSTSGHFRGCGICGVYFHSCVSVSLRSHFIKFGYFLKYFFKRPFIIIKDICLRLNVVNFDPVVLHPICLITDTKLSALSLDHSQPQRIAFLANGNSPSWQHYASSNQNIQTYREKHKDKNHKCLQSYIRASKNIHYTHTFPIHTNIFLHKITIWLQIMCITWSFIGKTKPCIFVFLRQYVWFSDLGENNSIIQSFAWWL